MFQNLIFMALVNEIAAKFYEVWKIWVKWK